MSSRGANADKETAWRLIFKEVCSLGLVHVACEPTENKNDLMSRRAPTQEIRHISWIYLNSVVFYVVFSFFFTELSLFILTTTLQILRCNESQRRSVLYLIPFNLIAESAVNRTSFRKFDQFQKKKMVAALVIARQQWSVDITNERQERILYLTFLLSLHVLK